jgi:L-alanine-DL-glutamate epimerase-like enolase superfamily enzyme
LVWLEEPTIPDDIYGHARILREGGVPIATGENFHTLHEFALVMRAEALPEVEATRARRASRNFDRFVTSRQRP